MNPLAFILHHANRYYEKSDAYYKIKDKILTKYAKSDGYDIQHIPGKKCWSCGGTGMHYYYSSTAPYKPYDSTDCWHCHNGWYKLPQWICLERKIFGGYIFHKPLRREFQAKNPWTAEGMGWQVSTRPIIEGYIDHVRSRFSRWAMLILFLLYDRKNAKLFWRNEVNWKQFIPRFIMEIKWKIEKWQWERRTKKNYIQTIYQEELEELPF